MHDEWFHKELLYNPRADLFCRIQSFKHMVGEMGFEPEQGRRALGLDEETARQALSGLERTEETDRK